MIVEEISNDEQNQLTSDTTNPLVCRIELTHKEAKAIIHSLGRTMCKGEQLDISIELEDKLFEVIKDYR